MDTLLKRMLDVSFGCVVIAASLPLWCLFILLIWIEENPPIFYIQERVGKNGNVFKVVKFRTMSAAERVETSFAKFLRITALDELPQILNIIKGDMSFVGPRPLINREMEMMRDEALFAERIRVQPGLTGIAQVLLPKDAPLQEKFLYDVWYARNRNAIMDIKLIAISYLITFMGRWELNVEKIQVLHNLQRRIDTDLVHLKEAGDA
ncbi:MAG: sugar transferase [Candidatus Omnitrophota bacterium]|nr:MAG: sugar transferase [Candidatus Omnitrophota bacterium]